VGLINMTICSWVPLTACHRGKLSRLLPAGSLITIWERLKWKGVVVRLPAGWQCGSDRPGAFEGLRRVVLIMDM